MEGSCFQQLSRHHFRPHPPPLHCGHQPHCPLPPSPSPHSGHQPHRCLPRLPHGAMPEPGAGGAGHRAQLAHGAAARRRGQALLHKGVWRGRGDGRRMALYKGGQRASNAVVARRVGKYPPLHSTHIHTPLTFLSHSSLNTYPSLPLMPHPPGLRGGGHHQGGQGSA